MKIIGYMRSNFRPKGSDEEITGYNVYISRPIAPDTGKGVAVDRVYLTDRKIDANGIDLAALFGKEVNIYYNRFGKVERITLAD